MSTIVDIRRLKVKKGFDQNLQLLPGHLSAVELQITLVSTAHSIPKVLWVNRLDLLLRSELTGRPNLIMNRRE